MRQKEDLERARQKEAYRARDEARQGTGAKTTAPLLR